MSDESTEPRPGHKDIHAAIAAIYAECGYVQKTGKVDGRDGGYKFAGEADILSALRPSMVKHGVTFRVIRYEDVTPGEYPTKAGGVMHTAYCKAVCRFTHAPTGTSIIVQALGFGADSGDKAIPKCQTIATKYALRSTFALETGDDPDKDASVERAPRMPHGRENGAGVSSGTTPIPFVAGRGISAPASGAPPATGSAEGVPPCDKCGGPGKTNPRHAENAKAPEFQCAGACEDPSKDGSRAFRHGYYAASEAQIKAVSAALAALGKDMESRGLSREDVDTRIRDWLESIGVPRSRKLFSKAHATKALDALKGHEFILDEIASVRREPGADDDVAF